MSLFNPEKSSILQDPKWLQPLSDPPGGKPLCRDADLKLIARHIADVFSSGQARNLFIYGQPGMGKTVCVRHVLSEVDKHASETNNPIQTVYVNAGKTRTPYCTMAEIVKQLGVNVPSAGVVKLPERVLSKLHPVLMYVAPYIREGTTQLLRELVERAIKPNTVADKMLTIIAKTANDAGDIRFGFRILLTATMLADKVRRKMIEAGDIASAAEDENRVRKLKVYETLRDQLLKLKKKHEKNQPWDEK